MIEKKEYNKNIAILMTGTTVAQAIPIAISPILTRIYTPHDFGVFAVFLALSYILGSIVNARYELAILLPRKDEDAIHIMALGLVIAFGLSITVWVVIILFKNQIYHYFEDSNLATWIYLVPCSIFVIGIYNLSTYYNNRKKQFKNMAHANFYKSLSMSCLHLIFGFFTGAFGLIVGYMVGMVTAIWVLIKKTKENECNYKFSKLKMIALAKRYKKFPQYSMWAILANKLAFNFTEVLISLFFSMSTLGHYTIVQRVLGVPSTLLGTAVSQVFFNQSADEKKLSGHVIKTLKYTLLKLFFIGLIIFSFIFFISEDLFALVFGEEWKIAGVYAKILIPLFFIRFVVSSISSVEIVMEKQNLGLVFNLLLLFTSIVIFLIFQNKEFEEFLKSFTIVICILYVLYGLLLIKISKSGINE